LSEKRGKKKIGFRLTGPEASSMLDPAFSIAEDVMTPADPTAQFGAKLGGSPTSEPETTATTA
jgi:hypothetical protein